MGLTGLVCKANREEALARTMAAGTMQAKARSRGRTHALAQHHLQ
jgi:hypothetical protein